MMEASADAADSEVPAIGVGAVDPAVLEVLSIHDLLLQVLDCLSLRDVAKVRFMRAVALRHTHPTPHPARASLCAARPSA